MIQVQRHVLGYYVVTMDKPDYKSIRRLADAYGIPFNPMLVGCINKGIDVISKQVAAINRHDGSTDDHSQDDVGG